MRDTLELFKEIHSNKKITNLVQKRIKELLEIRYNQGWNEAIDAAAESVELFYRNPHDDEDFRQMVPYDVDKESILKLKK